MLDRFDMMIEVPEVQINTLSRAGTSEDSTDVAARIAAARQFACQRPQQAEGMPNAHLSADMLEEVMGMDEKAHALIEDAATKQGLSARGYHRLLKVARTIADLDNNLVVTSRHIAEALQYRRLPVTA